MTEPDFSTVKKQHVATAIRQLLANGIAPQRVGTGYVLRGEETFLPPKEVLRRAWMIATNSMLGADAFSGGESGANRVLRDLGFEVIERSPRADDPAPLEPAVADWRMRIGLYLPFRPMHGVQGSWLKKLDDGALGKALDLVSFPEGFDCVTAKTPREQVLERWAAWARRQRVAVAIGIYCNPGQELWLISKKGKLLGSYRKHATTNRSALDLADYDATEALPVFPVGTAKVPVGLTLCHDHYLSPLQAALRRRGAVVLLNPSFSPSDSQRAKWFVCQRARAVENRAWSLCTLHDGGEDEDGEWRWSLGKARLFGFAPDGREIQFRPWPQLDGPTRVVHAKDLDNDAAPLWWCEIGPSCAAVDADDAGMISRLEDSEEDERVVITATPHGLRAAGNLVPWIPGTVAWPEDELAVLAVSVKTLQAPAACWRALADAQLANPASEHVRWVLWCRSVHTPAERLRWIAQSRSLELCVPVVLSHPIGAHQAGLSGYTLIAENYKRPARSENVASLSVPIKTGVQGGGLLTALNVLRGGAPSVRDAGRRRVNFLSSLRGQ